MPCWEWIEEEEACVVGKGGSLQPLDVRDGFNIWSLCSGAFVAMKERKSEGTSVVLGKGQHGGA